MENSEVKGQDQEEFDNYVLEQVRNSLSDYYLPSGSKPGELPFHNIDHALISEKNGIDYCKYVAQNGIKVDEFSIRFALLLHDAGYFENLDEVNNSNLFPFFETKEAYSKFLAKKLAQELGVSKPRINKLGKLILITNVKSEPITIEEKIMVRSDLDNVSGPYFGFFKNTMKLIEEAEMLNGPMNPIERAVALHDILNEYLSKDLSFGEFDKEFYVKQFKNPAIANIARISRLNIHNTIKDIGGIASKIFQTNSSSEEN